MSPCFLEGTKAVARMQRARIIIARVQVAFSRKSAVWRTPHAECLVAGCEVGGKSATLGVLNQYYEGEQEARDNYQN